MSASNDPSADETSSTFAFQLQVLGKDGVHTVPEDSLLEVGQWFAVVPTTTTRFRHRYIFQREGHGDNGEFAFYAMVDDPAAARLPAAGGWLRAMIAGCVQVTASNDLMQRADLRELIGGREPPTGAATPPKT